MRRSVVPFVVFVVMGLLSSCRGPTRAPEQRAWALALHGGAGTIPKDLPADVKDAYTASLRAALTLGRDLLEQGAPGLDVVERVVRLMEDDPLFNAGKGAVFNHDGAHELDAAIMDGKDLRCGAVAGARTVRNPISLARLVMERTPHVLLVGSGADAFAAAMGVEQVPQEYFFVQRRYDQWREALARERGDGGVALDDGGKKGTVGVVVLDRNGNLAAATSTGGLTNKRYGRVGDSPIIGAGTYANNRTVAISATGTGEEFIRHGVARDISALMEYRALSVGEAARQVVHGRLKPGDGGIIAVDRWGNVALVFNTTGMYRGAADSTGRFDVAIWE
ncbi:MAG: isoaspartyl peptidase/L-asparaginase [Myxococcota bacterium]